MEYSKYQLAVFDFIKNSNRNLVIDAVAGSGKTTTIVESLKYLPENGKVLMTCFNKHIANALQPRVPTGVEVKTFHSFGYSICRRNLWDLDEPDKRKVENTLRKCVSKEDFYKFKFAVSRLVDLFRYNCYREVPNRNDIYHMMEDQGIDLPKKENEFFLALERTYTGVINNTHVLDFTDMVFQPFYQNWAIPLYSVAFVDEVQDLNPIQQTLFKMACTRKIAVGDSRQAIYGWAGADANSMKNMIRDLGAEVLPLSICYRCPKSVVREAQKIVPYIESSPVAKEGKVERINIEKFRQQAQPGNYVLCRVTAPLVSECLKMIREGRKAVVKGRDIGQQLTALIDKISLGQDMGIDDFVNALGEWFNKEKDKLIRADKDDEIIALTDRVETVDAIVMSIDKGTVQDIKSKIDQIFSDTDSPGITFMTVHKAKGWESEIVFILKPELMPHPLAKKDWQKEQESNLKYVAVTRSMGELYYIKGN